MDKKKLMTDFQRRKEDRNSRIALRYEALRSMYPNASPSRLFDLIGREECKSGNLIKLALIEKGVYVPKRRGSYGTKVC